MVAMVAMATEEGEICCDCSAQICCGSGSKQAPLLRRNCDAEKEREMAGSSRGGSVVLREGVCGSSDDGRESDGNGGLG